MWHQRGGGRCTPKKAPCRAAADTLERVPVCALQTGPREKTGTEEDILLARRHSPRLAHEWHSPHLAHERAWGKGTPRQVEGCHVLAVLALPESSSEAGPILVFSDEGMNEELGEAHGKGFKPCLYHNSTLMSAVSWGLVSEG